MSTLKELKNKIKEENRQFYAILDPRVGYWPFKELNDIDHSFEAIVYQPAEGMSEELYRFITLGSILKSEFFSGEDFNINRDYLFGSFGYASDLEGQAITEGYMHGRHDAKALLENPAGKEKEIKQLLALSADSLCAYIRKTGGLKGEGKVATSQLNRKQMCLCADLLGVIKDYDVELKAETMEDLRVYADCAKLFVQMPDRKQVLDLIRDESYDYVKQHKEELAMGYLLNEFVRKYAEKKVYGSEIILSKLTRDPSQTIKFIESYIKETDTYKNLVENIVFMDDRKEVWKETFEEDELDDLAYAVDRQYEICQATCQKQSEYMNNLTTAMEKANSIFYQASSHPEFAKMREALKKVKEISTKIFGAAESYSVTTDDKIAYQQAVKALKDASNEYLEHKASDTNPSGRARDRMDAARQCLDFCNGTGSYDMQGLNFLGLEPDELEELAYEEYEGLKAEPGGFSAIAKTTWAQMQSIPDLLNKAPDKFQWDKEAFARSIPAGLARKEELVNKFAELTEKCMNDISLCNNEIFVGEMTNQEAKDIQKNFADLGNLMVETSRYFTSEHEKISSELKEYIAKNKTTVVSKELEDKVKMCLAMEKAQRNIYQTIKNFDDANSIVADMVSNVGLMNDKIPVEKNENPLLNSVHEAYEKMESIMDVIKESVAEIKHQEASMDKKVEVNKEASLNSSI